MEIYTSAFQSALYSETFHHWLRKIYLLLLVLLVLLLYPASASARVVGFVARDNDGNYYSYDYDALLDSYAMNILGIPNRLYADFSEKQLYALKDSVNGYVDYNDVVDSYARAIMGNSSFDIHRYTESGSAKKAAMPETLFHVAINGNRLIREEKIVGGIAGNTNGAVNAAGRVTAAPTDKPKPSSLPAGGSDASVNGGQAPEQEKQLPEPEKEITITPLQGAPQVSLTAAQAWARSKGAHQRFIDIAPLYWQYGATTGLRPEVLYAQAALETGFGRYGGQVPADYNNWAGIKTATSNGDRPEDHEQFASQEDGVRAHFNHISAYVGLAPIGEPHGRYHTVLRTSWAGTVKTVEDLSGRWAPSTTYHERIVSMIDSMK